LGRVYHAKAEIHIPGAGARLAAAEDSDRDAAEGKVLAESRRLIEKKRAETPEQVGHLNAFSFLAWLR
jgi:hypothetical protein